MKIIIGDYRIEVDAEKTRAWYETHPVTPETDAVVRNHARFMEEALDGEARAFLRALGVTHFGELRYQHVFGSNPDMREICLENAVFPVYGNANRLHQAREGRALEAQQHRAYQDPAPSMHAGNLEIGFVTPYLIWDVLWQPTDAPDDMLLLHLISPENSRWVLDDPMPDFREKSVGNGVAKRMEMLLHILGDQWEERPADEWRMITRECIRRFVRPKMRAEAEEWAGLRHRMSLIPSLGSALYKAFLPVYCEGEAAMARYDARKADRFFICIDFGKAYFYLYRVWGELPKSFHLARFRHRFVSTDLYVMPEDGSWLYAQDHESYVEPYSVSR